jgi:hypothetical protein
MTGDGPRESSPSMQGHPWRSGMGISAPAADERVADVKSTRETLSVALKDGRTITVPLTCYPRLFDATAVQRKNWRIAGGGHGIHCPTSMKTSAPKGCFGVHPIRGPRRSRHRPPPSGSGTVDAPAFRGASSHLASSWSEVRSSIRTTLSRVVLASHNSRRIESSVLSPRTIGLPRSRRPRTRRRPDTSDVGWPGACVPPQLLEIHAASPDRVCARPWIPIDRGSAGSNT